MKIYTHYAHISFSFWYGEGQKLFTKVIELPVYRDHGLWIDIDGRIYAPIEDKYGNPVSYWLDEIWEQISIDPTEGDRRLLYPHTLRVINDNEKADSLPTISE